MTVCLITILFVLSLVVALILKKVLWTPKIPDLHNKHVLITGGSSGIGKSTAIEAAALGAHVTIVARNEKKLDEALEEIKKMAKNPGSQIIQRLSLDVSRGLEEVDKAITAVEDSVGPIFLMVNCAGSAVCGDFDNATENDFRYMMDLNYFGTVYPTLSVVRKMKKRHEGHLVITGSQASLLGIYGMGAYCASKFALRGFAESLHMELTPYNVSVTVCLPPDTNTPGFENEQKSKPEITRLISETAGLFEPQVVARQMLSDALNKKFFSAVGFEGFIMTTLCAGMSPISSFTDVFLQISLMSLLRLVSVGYLIHFKNIILNNVKKSIGKKSNEKTE